MHTLLLMILILIPAPKTTPPAPHPLVGGYALQWGAGEQSHVLHADGTCDSQEYGPGLWTQDDSGYIWFGERNNACQYVMHVDLATGQGTGWRVDDDGVPRGEVPVRIRRGERLPYPREVE